MAEEIQWPVEIPDEDLDITMKEWWLMGYWAHRRNPGWIEVMVESPLPSPDHLVVAMYGKSWHGKTWRRRFPGVEEE